LVVTTEGKIPFRTLDDIQLETKECEGVDWIRLAQGRVDWLDFVKTTMNLRVPYMAETTTAAF
jgi:hypothetical protein